MEEILAKIKKASCNVCRFTATVSGGGIRIQAYSIISKAEGMELHELKVEDYYMVSVGYRELMLRDILQSLAYAFVKVSIDSSGKE